MYRKLVLGTAQFGMKYGISNKIGKIKSEDIHKILSFLKKKNINFLDSANQYKKSEQEIGKYCQKYKKKFNVITKYSLGKNTLEEQLIKTKNYLGYYPETILAHSYKDYLSQDYQIQIKKLKKKYPIKYFGVSLYNPQEFFEILKINTPDLIQVPCNIFDKRFLDKKILNIVKKKLIKFHVRSVFLQGLLFMKPTQIFKKFKGVEKEFSKIERISSNLNISISELSLLWVSKKKEIDKIIIGIDSLSHLQTNLKVLKKKISLRYNKEINQINLNNNKIIKPYLW